MSSVVAWADLKARVEAAGFTLDGTALRIAWPNRKVDPPIKGAFLLVEMTGGTSRPEYLGGVGWLDRGQAMIHVMVPVNTGVDGVWSVVDQVAAMFRRQPQLTVVYDQVTSDPGGPGSDEGNYWRTSVTADWHLQTSLQEI